MLSILMTSITDKTLDIAMRSLTQIAVRTYRVKSQLVFCTALGNIWERINCSICLHSH